MIAPEHDEGILGAVAVAVGLVSEENARVRAAGFDLDKFALGLEVEVCKAAADKRWGDVLLGLLGCAATDPEIYLPAWRVVAEHLLAGLRGSEALRGPGPHSTAIPIPPTHQTRQWSGPDGDATVLPSGDLRVIPIGARGSVDVIVLPLQIRGRRG